MGAVRRGDVRRGRVEGTRGLRLRSAARSRRFARRSGVFAVGSRFPDGRARRIRRAGGGGARGGGGRAYVGRAFSSLFLLASRGTGAVLARGRDAAISQDRVCDFPGTGVRRGVGDGHQGACDCERVRMVTMVQQH